MEHYFRTIFHYPDGEEEICEERYETKEEATWEGENGVNNFSAGADTMALAGEPYMDGDATFEVEECWENENGEIIKSKREDESELL